MEIYLVIDEWKRDFEHATTIVGVFKLREDAEACLASHIKSVQAEQDADKFDTIDQVEGDYYEAYNDGSYDDAYDHIWIEKQEVK